MSEGRIYLNQIIDKRKGPLRAPHGGGLGVLAACDSHDPTGLQVVEMPESILDLRRQPEEQNHQGDSPDDTSKTCVIHHTPP